MSWTRQCLGPPRLDGGVGVPNFATKGGPACKWCNEGQIGGGDLERNYYSSYEFCDGKSGWDKD